MVAMAEREEAQEKIYNKKVDFNRVIEEGWVFRDALKERHYSKNVWGAFGYTHYVCLNINRDLQEEGDKYKNTKPLIPYEIQKKLNWFFPTLLIDVYSLFD